MKVGCVSTDLYYNPRPGGEEELVSIGLKEKPKDANVQLSLASKELALQFKDAFESAMVLHNAR